MSLSSCGFSCASGALGFLGEYHGGLMKGSMGPHTCNPNPRNPNPGQTADFLKFVSKEDPKDEFSQRVWVRFQLNSQESTVTKKL